MQNRAEVGTAKIKVKMPLPAYLLVGVSLVQDDSADHGARHARYHDEEPDATGVLLRAGKVHHHHRVLGKEETKSDIFLIK